MLARYGLVTDHGKTLVWETDIVDYEEIKDLAKTKGQSSPFSRVDPWRINQALVLWLFQDLNMSGSYYIDIQRRPSIVKFTFCLETCNLIITKHSPAFKFITPFGVYRDGKSWGMFASPFDPDLWLCLLITVMALSAIITIFSKPPQHRKTNFIVRLQYKLLNTIAILFEHCEEYGKNQLESDFYHIRIVIQLYILMVVVISNAYKGTLKSDFSVEDDIKTKLQYFHQLQDFQFYMLSINGERDGLEVLGIVTPDGNVSGQLMKKSLVLADIQSRTFLKCQNNLPELLAKGPEAKHAFVTTSEDFDYNWDLIKSEMDKHSGEKIRLGHNRNVDDGFLSGVEGYSITAGLDKYHHWVPDRMKQILSSGIYNLWGKWNQIRFP
ncbi:unnamed protein product, partial [Allacma fusca]